MNRKNSLLLYLISSYKATTEVTLSASPSVPYLPFSLVDALCLFSLVLGFSV